MALTQLPALVAVALTKRRGEGSNWRSALELNDIGGRAENKETTTLIQEMEILP